MDTGPGSEQSPTQADPSALWQWASPTPYPADPGAEVTVGYGPPPGGQWGSWGWEAAPPPRPRRRLLAAVAFAAIFAVAAVAGLGVRLVVSPSSSPRTSTSLVPSTGSGTPGGGPSSGTGGSSSDNGSGGNGGNGSNGGNGGSGAGSSLTSAVIAGVVDVNVTLADGAGSAAGTGMVISSSGEVLTNNHVVDGAQSISVQVAGTGPTYSAHVLGYDVTADVALIKVDGAPSLTTVNLGDSSTVSVGDAVTAVGNALGRSGPPSVTTGSVTALDQQITASDQGGANAETLNGLIQIDALIQPGDSGGPLVNAANQVVGMDTAAASSGRFRIRQQGSRVAFAIPINAALTIAHEIEAGGGGDSAVQTGDRAFLGVGTQDGNGDGAQVTSVQQGSPADDAGLAAGDVITGLDGTTVDSPTTLRSAILRHHPGDRVGVTWRDGSGNQHTATVTLTSGPPA